MFSGKAQLRSAPRPLCTDAVLAVTRSSSQLYIMASKTNDSNEVYFWMGAETFKVPMSMHAENRTRLLSRMEGVVPKAGVILLKGAVATTRDDTDHEPLIRQESFFQYLFGVKEPDCYAAISLATGHAHLFIPRLDRAYQVWMGRVRFYVFRALAEQLESTEAFNLAMALTTNPPLFLFPPDFDYGRVQGDVRRRIRALR